MRQITLSPLELKALKDLIHDSSILILKADKGNATVITNRTDYDENVKEIFSEELMWRGGGGGSGKARVFLYK